TPPAVPGVTLPSTGPASAPPVPGVTLPSPSPMSGGPLPPPGLTLPTKPADAPPGAPGSVTIPGVAPMPMEKATEPMKVELHTERSVGREDFGPGATESNPTGRQEPAVSLEWIGPPAAKVGNASDYTIVVRNVCNIAVQQVLVRVRLQQGVQIVATEPKAVTEDNVLMWEVGTMLPKQERNLQLKMLCPTKGDVNCQAWVTFTGSSAMRIRVREPKLMIKVTAPEKVLIGDPCTYLVTVSNPGDHPAERVKIHCDLSEGLEHAKGNKIDFDVGNLNAGETRSVQVICGTKAGGEQKCEAYSEAEGGLKAADKAVANVIMPNIKLEANGPKLKYLDRRAVYTFKVSNPGDAPAFNVTVSDVIPPGFKFLQADNGGRHDFSTRTVSWFIGELGPNQSREVKFECLAVNPGEHQHKVLARASRGIKDETVLITRVDGLSSILMELVDLDDPIEVGAETSYEIRITNTGSKTETDVKLVCVVPDKMQFKSATGPAKFQQSGNEIVFEPIPRLAPRADAIFRVTVKTTAAGVVHFKSRITSTLLVDPVTKEEATRIYSD
ncbi:MAG TPA: hypothetical protein VL371_25985, partial [Gemmataceae bacterium]|nr:hypothetical protein [Gemmataceae bacterium]